MNQDFNNQNNNMQNNQPVFGNPIENNSNQSTQNNQPVFGNPVENNTNPPTQNNNNNNNINMQPKKNNLPIIIGAIAVIAIIVGCIFIFGGEKSQTKTNTNTNSNEEIKEKPLKPIKYYNSKSIKTTDKIAFNLEYSYSSKKGIFFGIQGKGVANNLNGDSSFFENDVIAITRYLLNDEVSIYYNEESYLFEIERGEYSKDSAGEYFDEEPIVHKENNYFITKNIIDSYTLYYLYEEDYNEIYQDGINEKVWYTVLISYFDTVEEAKSKMKKIDSNIDICTYDKSVGYDNCLSSNGSKIDIENYKHLNDVLIDSLMDYDLYIDNYNDITELKYNEVYIEKKLDLEGAVEDSITRFEIEFDSDPIDNEDVVFTSTLNGKEVKFEKPYSAYYANIKNGSNYIEIYINLSSGAEVSEENVIKALEKTFSKSK